MNSAKALVLKTKFRMQKDKNKKKYDKKSERQKSREYSRLFCVYCSQYSTPAAIGFVTAAIPLASKDPKVCVT